MATPRSRRPDAFTNVHRIVAAAREVFGRDGVNATLSQVADAAGVVTDIKPAILALGRGARRAAFIDDFAHLEDVMFRQRPLLTSIGDLADLTAQLFTRDREQFDDMIMQAQATGALRPDLTSDDVATFVAMVTTASVPMNQPRPMRRRYLSLTFDALIPVRPSHLRHRTTAEPVA